jgi:hypothetical protein
MKLASRADVSRTRRSSERSFCDRHNRQEHMVGGRDGLIICAACVARCADILDRDTGIASPAGGWTGRWPARWLRQAPTRWPRYGWPLLDAGSPGVAVHRRGQHRYLVPTTPPAGRAGRGRVARRTLTRRRRRPRNLRQ